MRRLLAAVLVAALLNGAVAQIALPVPAPALPGIPMPPQAALIYAGAVALGGILAYIYDLIVNSEGDTVAEDFELELIEPDVIEWTETPPVPGITTSFDVLGAYTAMAGLKSSHPIAPEMDIAAQVTEAYLSAMFSDLAYAEDHMPHVEYDPSTLLGWPYYVAEARGHNAEYPAYEDVMEMRYNPQHGRFVINASGIDADLLLDMSLSYGAMQRVIPAYTYTGLEEGQAIPLAGPRTFGSGVGMSDFWDDVEGRARLFGVDEALTRLTDLGPYIYANEMAGVPYAAVAPMPENWLATDGLFSAVPRFVHWYPHGSVPLRGYYEDLNAATVLMGDAPVFETTFLPLVDGAMMHYEPVFWPTQNPEDWNEWAHTAQAIPERMYQVHMVPFSYEIELDWGNVADLPVSGTDVGWLNPAYMHVSSVVPVVVTWALQSLVDQCGMTGVICTTPPSSYGDESYQVFAGVYEAVSVEGGAGYAWSELVLPMTVLGATEAGQEITTTGYDLLVSFFTYEMGAQLTHQIAALEEWWRGAWLQVALGIAAPPVTVQDPVLEDVLPWNVVGAPDFGVDVQDGTGAEVWWMVNPMQAIQNAFIPTTSLAARAADLRLTLEGRFPFSIAAGLAFTGAVGSGPLTVPSITVHNGLVIQPRNQWLNNLGGVTRTAATVLLIASFAVWARGKLTPKAVI